MKQLLLQNPLFEDLQTCFADWLTVLGYSATSVKGLPLQLREFFYYLEENQVQHIGQVKSEQVKGFFQHLSLRASQRDGGKLSAAYLCKYWQAIKKLDQYLRQTGEWGLTLPAATGQPERRLAPVLTQAEVSNLFAATAVDPLGLRDSAMLALFYGCGLRRSEGIGLDLADVLLEKGLVYVRKGKNYRERYVPMSQGVAGHVRRYLEEGRPLLLSNCPYSGKQDKRALLVSSRGKRINDRTLTIRIHLLQERSGNGVLLRKRVSLHSLRHAIATHLLERGMRLQDIARFLGHTKLESTQIYTHLVDAVF